MPSTRSCIKQEPSTEEASMRSVPTQNGIVPTQNGSASAQNGGGTPTQNGCTTMDNGGAMAPCRAERITPIPTAAFEAAQQRIPSSSSGMVRNDDVDMANAESETGVPASFAERPMRLIKAIQKLGDLGIQNTLPSRSLPKIVVVGDQSHGKSSIIEAVCDIALPRDEETCTRCPFRITTTGYTEQWSCKISLGREYVDDGCRWVSANTDEASKFIDFTTITSKSELDHVLRRAQLAILNPDMDPKRILEDKNVELNNSKQFSPNVISLDIASPDLPELSLFDLPGAINVTENPKDQQLVKFIENLIRSYIHDPTAMVLLAVTADADTHTSTTFRFAGDVQALERCTGVLTKPDLMAKTKNQISRLRSLFGNDKFKLGNGWFVTKQPSQEELDDGISYAEARRREMAFFERDPWSTTSLQAFSHRFGISSLQKHLSQKLTQHILQVLPEINGRVEGRLQYVTKELSGFPGPAIAPSITVMQEINELNKAIVEQLRGDGLKNKFRVDYKKLLQDLRGQLQISSPKLLVKTPGYKQPVIDVDSDDDDDNASMSQAPTPTPSKKRKVNNGRGLGTPTISPVKNEDGSTTTVGETFRLDEIKARYNDGSSSGLEDDINSKVTDDIILQCTRKWGPLITSTLNKIERLGAHMLVDTTRAIMTSRLQTQLYSDTWDAIEALYRDLMREQRSKIDHLVTCETHKPTTYAYADLKREKEAATQKLLEERKLRRVNEYFDTLEAEGNSSKITKPETRKAKTKEEGWISSTLGPDAYTREIEAIGTVKAYYKVASVNLLDIVAKHLQYGLMHGLEEGLKGLPRMLGTEDVEHCAQLLAEDPGREEVRRGLLRERERLEAALGELRGLVEFEGRTG